MGLIKYIAGRVGVYLVVLFTGITIIFFLPRFMPGDPIEGYIGRMQYQAGQTLSAEDVESLRASLRELYGLTGSLPSQYLGFIKRVFISGDFGPSLAGYPRPVSEYIATALPWTLGLLTMTTILAWTTGNLIGLFAGFFHNKRIATVLEVIGVTLYPIPYYILALVLIILFAYIWPIFPLSTTIMPGALTMQKVGEIFRNSFLPGMALVLAGFGWNVLGMKAMAYSTKEEAFVNYARLKGTPPFTIMIHYVWRNAFLPQITALALHMGMIFNGAILTEMLFSYPGVGSLIRSAIGNGDYNMIYGTLSLSIVAVATTALAIDLLYPLFDPRIRYK
ncbi:MAG: ABC transporter permease [Chloroflexi bacterium]|nr:ABC transporter permease [Chloroflexota bacterium]